MKYFLLISLILHILPVFLLNTPRESFPKQDPVEVELTEQENSGEFENGSNNVTILEYDESEENVSNDYYWGIGVTVSYLPTGILITSVAKGYCAEKAGLKDGDLIILIDGFSPKENDLRGDGPKSFNLTLDRNSVILSISLSRCKVYY